MIPAFGTDRSCDIYHGRDGRCEDEAFESGILPGGLEDGECSGDRRLNYSF